jgi:hypothetical protein
MASVAGEVMSTARVPGDVLVMAAPLAAKKTDSYDCRVFVFLNEVSSNLRRAFIDEMGISTDAAAQVAKNSPVSPESSCQVRAD